MAKVQRGVCRLPDNEEIRDVTADACVTMGGTFAPDSDTGDDAPAAKDEAQSRLWKEIVALDGRVARLEQRERASRPLPDPVSREKRARRGLPRTALSAAPPKARRTSLSRGVLI